MKPYKCPKCGARFKLGSKLMGHFKREHPEIWLPRAKQVHNPRAGSSEYGSASPSLP